MTLPDIKPQTPVAALDRDAYLACTATFPVARVAPLVGMSPTFIRRVTGKPPTAALTGVDVLGLVDQDAYRETFVRRSQVLDHLLTAPAQQPAPLPLPDAFAVHPGDALTVAAALPAASVGCVVTSPPYWAVRVYDEPHWVRWADGEHCPYGHEQTPDGYVRHTVEILHALARVLTPTGSVWWNVMDTYNTRAPIRGNAVEALRAMQGRTRQSWAEHACRRYSAGHAYLKDGEQCLIPHMIAERASRIGLYVRSVITWSKTAAIPDPQNSRVSRTLEYVLHLTRERTPTFDKTAYRHLPPALGGRDARVEMDRLSDVWTLPTSAGGNGHGAQFALALPGRCIGLSTAVGGLVLDPFAGTGNTGIAALRLGRRFLGVDASARYAQQAQVRLAAHASTGVTAAGPGR